jgi:arylsulfatase B
MYFFINYVLIHFVFSATLILSATPPNIIVIVADDLGYGELSCQGSQDIPTPHIDSLAKNGVRFTSGYVTAPFCSASRAGLMTGRYQTRFGYESNPIGATNENPNYGLPISELTMAEFLKEKGYATGLVGKWHLGATAHFHPIRSGFDEFFGFMHEGHFFVPPPYHGVTTMLRQRVLPHQAEGMWISKDGKMIYSQHVPQSNEPSYDANNPIIRGGQPIEEKEYLTDAFTRESIDFIDRNSDRPFFLYLSYSAVHSPLQGADAYMNKFSHIKDIQRRIFAAMLSNLDDSVGDVLNKLKSEGLEEDTLIFFLSDNGGPTKELTSSNGKLREGKGKLYEGGTRVPFMMQWKGSLPSNKIIHDPIISLDIFATIADLTGGTLKKQKPLDGISLMPHLIENKVLPNRDFFWRVKNKGAYRQGPWKLLKNPIGNKKDVWELYHLENDLSETNNLAKQHPEKLKTLKQAWIQQSSQMVAPLF